LAEASVHILVRVEVLRSRDGNCRDPASGSPCFEGKQ